MLGLDAMTARRAWTYAVVLLSIWLVYALRRPIILFVLSVMFAYLLSPGVRFLRHRLRLQRNLTAVLLLYAIGILAVGGTVVSMRGPARREGRALHEQLKSPQFREDVMNWRVLGFPVGRNIIGNQNFDGLRERVQEEMPRIRDEAFGLGETLGTLVLIPIVAFVLLIDGQRLTDAALHLIFHAGTDEVGFSDREIVAMGVLTSAHILISEYMRSLMLLCVAVLFAYAAVLSMLRVPYAVLLALVACPLEFIPVLGPIAAGVFILLVCGFSHYSHVVLVILFLLAYRFFQDYILSPQLMKRSVQLHPLAVIFGIFAGGQIGGIAGVFLSIPLLALARLVFYEYRKHNEMLRRATVALAERG